MGLELDSVATSNPIAPEVAAGPPSADRSPVAPPPPSLEEDADALLARSGDEADDDAARRDGSARVRWDARRGVSVFADIEPGAFHAKISELDGGASAPREAEEFRYDEGYEIVDDGAPVGTIVRFLGQGAMGTVYLMRPHGRGDSGAPLCAAKAVRADARAAARREMEKQLAVEVSISFTLGQ